MAAYGRPELMDPTEAMLEGVMQALRGFKERIEGEFPTFDSASAPMILDQFRNYMLTEMGAGARAAELEGLIEKMMDAENYEDMWNRFKKAYASLAKESRGD
jgi:hypothetical protein